MKEKSFLNVLTSKLKKTKFFLLTNLNKIINKDEKENKIEELTSLLIKSDIGLETTTKIINHITNKIKKNNLNNMNLIIKELSIISNNILNPCQIELNTDIKKPFVLLIVGINGVGKTSTIGKIANFYTKKKKNILLAAGDTYREASIEQLEILGKKNNIQTIKQHYGADSASVIFDALKIAKKKEIDILIADTSGRLHTNEKLLNELKKIKRVLKKIDETAPHEIMLILDATHGQNALKQAKKFNEELNISGITITKLDGTAKAGIILPIADELKIPIRFICIGENIEDIKIFDSKIFTDSLFNKDI